MTDPAKVLPAGVVEALKAGNKIEAIKRMRESSGIGLAEAKAMIDAIEHHTRALAKGQAHSGGAPHAPHPNQPLPHRPGGLSPGEVPRAGGGAWWLLALVAIGVVMYLLFRK